MVGEVKLVVRNMCCRCATTHSACINMCVKLDFVGFNFRKVGNWKHVWLLTDFGFTIIILYVKDIG